ncbi:prepilin peptidase [Ectothiorhodospira mobilis]|uniref:prepilin peptidase n=1 Tax=Ectothiorhodospira mobilis TaxID=195064 RepID=UPI001EE82456|nr:A24 family peptidase [Ectothiorhodospira mobilis]MCG5534510.1 A24 family peptidase [Ectothiorhodospira mobilis]
MTDLLGLHPAWILAAAALLGVVTGSFLNVVIHRLPVMMERQWQREARAWLGKEDAAGEEAHGPFNLLVPGSRCPACGHRIGPLENIPLLSYLVLRGRCAACRARISPQYPLVEGVTAVLSVVVVAHFGVTWAGAAALALTWSLLALAVIDLRTSLLPDALTLPVLWLGLLVNLGTLFTDPTSSLLGAVIGYLSLWGVYQAFRLLTGKEGMGYGDFKLFALLGAWLGWQMLPLVILLASLVGALVGIALIVLRGRDRELPIPFGPYLAAAGWIALLWGDPLVTAYLRGAGLAW